MKVNKKVSGLARKLDYITVNLGDRRRIIKKCVNPLIWILGGFYIERQINKGYNYLKKEMDELEKQRLEYEKSLREIRYVAIQN